MIPDTNVPKAASKNARGRQEIHRIAVGLKKDLYSSAKVKFLKTYRNDLVSYSQQLPFLPHVLPQTRQLLSRIAPNTRGLGIKASTATIILLRPKARLLSAEETQRKPNNKLEVLPEEPTNLRRHMTPKKMRNWL